MLVKSQVKYIQSLSQKKFRDEEGVFIAEGPKIINELLAGNAKSVKGLYALKSWLDLNQGLVTGLPSQLVSEITAGELGRISLLSTPNEVLGVFDKPVFKEPADPETSLVIMLDNIQDPGNLGTIIRCADWFGIKKIVCNPGSADNFNPKVVQSTMASIIRVEVVYTDLGAYLLAAGGVPIYAAALHGDPLGEFAGVKNGVLVIGNESRGISDEIFALATKKITIPKFGEAESLNAAVATGILLSHLVC